MSKERVLVTGAGGFIGSHLVKFLKDKGYYVRGVDTVEPEFSKTAADDFQLSDLRIWDNCNKICRDIDMVYNLAANMGGIGFIEIVKAEVMRDNILINTHMLEAARQNKVKRFFFSSSACVYPVYKQNTPDVKALKEDDVYPAEPDNEYGWEKLYTERMCKAYTDEYGLETRVARFHNIFGPCGTWDGGKEKSPAAICRKISEADNNAVIEIWGDGKQTRSYCYVDDCLEGIYRLMMSDYREPLNIGSDRLLSINELADIVIAISGKKLSKRYDLSKPQGVRGRNCDCSLCEKILNWKVAIGLEEGLRRTYLWIDEQVKKAK